MYTSTNARFFVFKRLFFVFLKSLISLDADVWKKFLSRPALPFILRLLRGLATQHPPTQVQNALNIRLNWSQLRQFFL